MGKAIDPSDRLLLLVVSAYGVVSFLMEILLDWSSDVVVGELEEGQVVQDVDALVDHSRLCSIVSDGL